MDELPDFLDAHVESFLWSRMGGYDIGRSHGSGLLGARLYSQADVPRMVAAGMTGAVFSIATNPLRRASGRSPTLERNVAALTAMLRAGGAVEVVADAAAYRRARAAGRFAAMIAVQGGNACVSGALPAEVTRVTLVHLTRSALGVPARPGGRAGGLTAAGLDLVCRLNERRVMVDLAHVHRDGFWEALTVHDPGLPPIVSHTGVRGVHDCWRNVDDDQVRAIAERGGVVGIMYHCGLRGGFLGGRTSEAVLAHLRHVVDVGGEDAACLGSDWDGFIVPPKDMRTAAEIPILVSAMRAAGWSEARVAKVLGGNYLRVLSAVRPGS